MTEQREPEATDVPVGGDPQAPVTPGQSDTASLTPTTDAAAQPAADPVVPDAAALTTDDDLTGSAADTTVVTPVDEGVLGLEAERIAARAAERAERNRALGKVERPPLPEPPPVVLTAQVRTTDRWHGALGLFALRLVLGAIMLVRGIQHLSELTATQQFLNASTMLPYPEILGWVLGIGEVLIAVALIVGFMVRIAGIGALAISVLALVFVLWGSTNPFVSDVAGFTGDFELLVAGVGLLFLLVGGGRWGIDGAMRRRRRLKKETKAAA